MKIKVVESVFQANDAVAGENRGRADSAGVLMVNIMSAPGSGKTTLLEQTLLALGPDKCAVLVGDLQTVRDAERLGVSGSQVVQINTGRGCHLSAGQVAQGLNELNLTGLSYIFIENVGNMVCPASFDLGEHKRAVLLSIPEGDDKVAKYWTLFQGADVILLNKIDLLSMLDFNPNRVREDLSKINTHAPFLEISARTSQGLQVWLDWLQNEHGFLTK